MNSLDIVSLSPSLSDREKGGKKKDWLGCWWKGKSFVWLCGGGGSMRLCCWGFCVCVCGGER